jgi:hypothetical protein
MDKDVVRHGVPGIVNADGVFDLNVQVESTTGVTGITGKSKTKPPRAPPGLLFLTPSVRLMANVNAYANDSAGIAIS